MNTRKPLYENCMQEEFPSRKSALYFYYYGLEISGGGFTPKYKTVVLASDLRDGILQEIPHYGLRPAVLPLMLSLPFCTPWNVVSVR